jgi:hypothetical protein
MHKKRNRSRPAESFEVRLQRHADRARATARTLPPGKDRDELMKKAIETENVLNVSELLSLDRKERADRPSTTRKSRRKFELNRR